MDYFLRMKYKNGSRSTINSPPSRLKKNAWTPFRYFPRGQVTFTVIPPANVVYSTFFYWTLKDGTLANYFYANSGYDASVYLYNAIQLNPPVPALAGGYLFNFGIRSGLTLAIYY